jgi:hypothetical protein
VRTIGEATLFLVRALAAERDRGHDHPEWAAVVDDGVAAMLRSQDPNGSFGRYIDAPSGRVVDRHGTAGLIWICVLLEVAAALGGSALAHRYRDAAIRAGEAYAQHVTQGLLFGAPEDVSSAPTSEDGYNAVMAYTALLEHAQLDGDGRAPTWARLARAAADWSLTFRFSYDVLMPVPSILADHDFRTQGGDVASPANPHLHSYGLVCVPAMMRLAGWLEDPELRRWALAHVRWSRQFVARGDGDFNARRGMVTGRFLHTDAFGPKGSLLPLSHAWCLGLILQAAEDELAAAGDELPAAASRAGGSLPP